MGLYKIRADMDKAASEAMGFFLMLDKDDERRLDYKQFVRLLLNVFAGEGTNFFKAADFVIDGMNKKEEADWSDMQKLTVAEKTYNDHQNMAKDESEVSAVTDALQYAKLHKLFNLYDTSGNGMISLEELLLACRKFHKTRGIPVDSTINETVITMLYYDEDKNQNMDKNEFALCVVRFAKICHKDLPEMIDYLANAILLGENNPGEEEYMKSMIAVEADNLKSMQELAVPFKEKKQKLDDLSKKTADLDESKKGKYVSEYVKNARENLAIEIEYYDTRLDILECLAELSQGAKFEVIFGMLDRDANGRVNARELSNNLRKVNPNSSFRESMEKASTYIAMYDSDYDGTLDREEFRNFVMRMTADMGSTFKEMAEWIVMTLTFSTGGHNQLEDAILETIEGSTAGRVKKQSIYISALSDERFLKLFTMFDQNYNGTVEYKEVAMGLYKLHGDMDKSTQEAMDFFLMLDKEDKRRLYYEQFVELILKIFAREGAKIFNIIDDVIGKMNKAKKASMKDDAILVISGNIYNAHQDMMAAEREDSEVIDAMQYAKLHKLFDLYDTSNDGLISLEELLVGCRKFHQVLGIDVDVTIEETTLTMLAYDKDKNQKMDKDEFALCVVRYAKKNNMELRGMVDFLANAALLEDNTPEEMEYMKSMMDIEGKKLKSMQNVPTDDNGGKKDVKMADFYVVNDADNGVTSDTPDVKYRKNYGTIENPELWA